VQEVHNNVINSITSAVQTMTAAAAGTDDSTRKHDAHGGTVGALAGSVEPCWSCSWSKRLPNGPRQHACGMWPAAEPEQLSGYLLMLYICWDPRDLTSRLRLTSESRALIVMRSNGVRDCTSTLLQAMMRATRPCSWAGLRQLQSWCSRSRRSIA